MVDATFTLQPVAASVVILHDFSPSVIFDDTVFLHAIPAKIMAVHNVTTSVRAALLIHLHAPASMVAHVGTVTRKLASQPVTTPVHMVARVGVLKVHSAVDNSILLTSRKMHAFLGVISKINIPAKTLPSTHLISHARGVVVKFGQHKTPAAVHATAHVHAVSVVVVDESTAVIKTDTMRARTGALSVMVVRTTKKLLAVRGMKATARRFGVVIRAPSRVTGLKLHSKVGALNIVLQQLNDLLLTELDVNSQLGDTADNAISLSYSDDRGATYNNPVTQSLGKTGMYNTSLQFLRLGLSRSRVFQIEYSCDTFTALKAIFVDATESAT